MAVDVAAKQKSEVTHFLLKKSNYYEKKILDLLDFIIFSFFIYLK